MFVNCNELKNCVPGRFGRVDFLQDQIHPLLEQWQMEKWKDLDFDANANKMPTMTK